MEWPIKPATHFVIASARFAATPTRDERIPASDGSFRFVPCMLPLHRALPPRRNLFLSIIGPMFYLTHVWATRG